MLNSHVRDKFYDVDTQYYWQRIAFPQLHRERDVMLFLNPPAVAVVLAPLSNLSLSSTYIVWGILNLSVLVLLGFILVHHSAEHKQEKTSLYYVLPIFLLFPPLVAALIQGQITLWLLLALFGGWFSFSRQQYMRSGLWLSLLVIRPNLLIVPILLLLLKKQWSCLFGIGIGCASFFLISIYAIGLTGLVQYFHLLLQMPTLGEVFTIHPQHEPTLRALLLSLWQTNNVSQINLIWIAGVAFVMLLLVWSWRMATPRPGPLPRWPPLLPEGARFATPGAYLSFLQPASTVPFRTAI
jgi:hypothetical protein